MFLEIFLEIILSSEMEQFRLLLLVAAVEEARLELRVELLSLVEIIILLKVLNLSLHW